MAKVGRPRKILEDEESIGGRVVKALAECGKDGSAASLWIVGHVERIIPVTSQLHDEFARLCPESLVGTYTRTATAEDVESDVKTWHRGAMFARRTAFEDEDTKSIARTVAEMAKAVADGSEINFRLGDFDRRMIRMEKLLQVRLTQTVVMTEVCRSEPMETRMALFDGWLRAMDMSDDWWIAHGDLHSVAEWRLALLQLSKAQSSVHAG